MSYLPLENVDNTSDANKPVSSATQSAIDAKANVGDSFSISLDGQGAVLTTGIANYVMMKKSGTIVGWDIVSSISGSVVFDIWKSTDGTLPTVADTITASAKPTLTTDVSVTSTSVGTWSSVTFVAGDIFAFNVDSVTSVEKATLNIRYNN
jgi:hypothetical protein